jgi:histidyl-tRNA synthetase
MALLIFAIYNMKPSLPQGTRDFNAQTVRKRQFILQTIQHVFELYGYEPLETPSMENLSTLTGKYGEEGDRLIFKILNNGLNDVSKHDKTKAALNNVLAGKSDSNLTERALRYDLTIPFARFVAMNRNELALPFKRYQMQPVWRADKPQRGRYREFWQCDADVVGSKSLLLEAEFLNIYDTVFEQLGIPNIQIRINNRKILSALAELIGKPESITDITIAIDKLDKIGLEKVCIELQNKGIDDAAIEQIKRYLHINGTEAEKLIAINILLNQTENGKAGIEELVQTLDYLQKINKHCKPILDFTLARGLDYYTGLIVEVKTTAVQMGSIGGGGRYDNLTGVFDYPDVSGMGISFGVDRIYDVMEELQLFPASLNTGIAIMFINFGAACEEKCLDYVQQLRTAKIACELYPDASKFDKQMKYANKRNYPFIAIVGENELEANTITLKNYATGEQTNLSIETLISQFKKH